MTENDTLTPPPAPTPPPETPRRPQLRRSRSQRVLGGVSGGLAEHTGIDTLLFRVAFVVLVFAGGAGFFLYAALWLLLPDADGRRGPLRRWLDDRPSDLSRWTVLTIGACVLLLLVVGDSEYDNGADTGLLALVAIAVIGYLWWREREDTPDTRSTAAVAAPITVGAPPDPTYPATVATPVPPRPRRPRSRLGRITVSLLLLALGVLAVLDQSGDVEVSTVGYLATALGVVGAGLLVGTFWGRSRGLIVLGIPLLLVLIPVSVTSVDLRDGLGERFWSPDSAAELDDEYRLGAGHGRLDLRDIDFEGTDTTTEVSVNVGYAEVLVPSDVDVTVRGEVDTGGEIRLFEQRVDGSDVTRTVTDEGADGSGGGELELIVNVNVGVLEVTRVP